MNILPTDLNKQDSTTYSGIYCIVKDKPSDDSVVFFVNDKDLRNRYFRWHPGGWQVALQAEIRQLTSKKRTFMNFDYMIATLKGESPKKKGRPKKKPDQPKEKKATIGKDESEKYVDPGYVDEGLQKKTEKEEDKEPEQEEQQSKDNKNDFGKVEYTEKEQKGFPSGVVGGKYTHYDPLGVHIGWGQPSGIWTPPNDKDLYLNGNYKGSSPIRKPDILKQKTPEQKAVDTLEEIDDIYYSDFSSKHARARAYMLLRVEYEKLQAKVNKLRIAQDDELRKNKNP